MKVVDYSTTTLSKQGTLVVDNVTYSVNVVAVNNELSRLSCSISRRVMKQYPDGGGSFVENPEDIHVGHITLEHGRQVIEVIQGEDLVPHITVFQNILDEVLGNVQEVDPENND